MFFSSFLTVSNLEPISFVACATCGGSGWRDGGCKNACLFLLLPDASPCHSCVRFMGRIPSMTITVICDKNEMKINELP